MTTKALQPEQWQVLHRLRSAGCPIDYEHLPAPLHVFTEPGATQVLTTSSGTRIALLVRVVASTSITIRRFHLRADWLNGEISWLEFCDQHPGNSQKHYCFHEYSGRNVQFSSEDVLNHRTLHRGVLKRNGFLSGYLLGTFQYAHFPTGIGTKLEVTLGIEDLFEHEYEFPIVLIDHTSESDWEEWMWQRASAMEGTVGPLTGNEDEPM
jgi:hypothetical protein